MFCIILHFGTPRADFCVRTPSLDTLETVENSCNLLGTAAQAPVKGVVMHNLAEHRHHSHEHQFASSQQIRTHNYLRHPTQTGPTINLPRIDLQHCAVVFDVTANIIHFPPMFTFSRSVFSPALERARILELLVRSSASCTSVSPLTAAICTQGKQ